MTRIYGAGQDDLAQAANALVAGGVVAVPSETVYGLAANALDPSACRKIFSLKGRPLIDPLIVHVHALEGAKTLAVWNGFADRLAEAFWPGPLTFVLPKKSLVPPIVTAGLDTVAVRMPRHPLFRKLLLCCNLPLAAPSANPFGYLSPTRPGHVLDSFGSELEYLVDGGACEIGLESTVVDLCGGGGGGPLPVVLRLGAIASRSISEILGVEVVEKPQILPAGIENEKKGMISPGLLHKHYSPRTAIAIAGAGAGWHEELRIAKGSGRGRDQDQKRIAFIAFQKPEAGDVSGLDEVFWLTESGELEEAARNLFHLLHVVDDLNFDRILIEAAPEGGLGSVINERLRRATGS